MASDSSSSGSEIRRDQPTDAVLQERLAAWRKESSRNLKWYAKLCKIPFDPKDKEVAIQLLALEDFLPTPDGFVPHADGHQQDAEAQPLTPAKRARQDFDNKDKDEEEESKGEARCCGKILDANFCELCGKAASSRAQCLGCHKEIASTAAFCKFCGFKVAKVQDMQGTSSFLADLASPHPLITNYSTNTAPTASSTLTAPAASASAARLEMKRQVQTWDLVNMIEFVLASGDARFRYMASRLKSSSKPVISAFDNMAEFSAAWAMVTAVALEEAPNHVSELVKHQHRIAALTANGHPWRVMAEYDMAVRYRKAAEPSRFSLADLDQDALSLATKAATSWQQRPRPAQKPSDSRSKDLEDQTCRKFNNGECKFGERCRYRHECSTCGSMDHGQKSCSVDSLKSAFTKDRTNK